MRKFYIFFASVLLPVALLAQPKPYNIIIKGGHVIDPKNNINRVMDVAIANGKVAKIATGIDASQASSVVNAEGMYVTPGLIDIHGHVFAGTQPNQMYSNGFSSVMPDGFYQRVGVTTVVDAGGTGWKDFPIFKKNIIDNSQTRVLSFMNIVGSGMRGGPVEQNVDDMDPVKTAEAAMANKEYVVGIKVAHFTSPSFVNVDRGVEAGKIANMPVMIDFGGTKPRLSIRDLFMTHLRPGDIFTHTFGELLDTKEAIVDTGTQKLKPFVLEAQKRGIVFDVGYGGSSFTYSQAIPAAKAGFHPNTISTDLHISSMKGSMKDMLSVMSKFLKLGMDLPSVIKASSWAPAQAIKRTELGHLSEGAIADIAILGMRKGNFGFYDLAGYKMQSNEKLECEMTIKDGRIVYDLNGIVTPLPKR
ncbi:MAG: amidohydrolase/deacetylase family metallohydrolase [Daejeonella sp.]|uniref:amidohydrolase/deacetylase family metallohydrolase n=1 Tax=Daejeonella sp. JGW-45 TaxID=3034148 RepID=UPI0023ED1269|nr:amidohydrolase/deacetylase family metallohydrolase [Daejeonella sp. JGW-45]